jgi:hypothetical protein
MRYAAAVIESFVDLTYRGLALGRRIKLTQVRPTTGYLELPMPMPVGTLVAITTDEGVPLEAVVTSIHEQVGGSDRVPGMTVKPALTGEAAQAWWQARVGLPEESEGKGPTRDRPITVRPRTHTVPAPPPEAAKEVAAKAVNDAVNAAVTEAQKPEAEPPVVHEAKIKEEDIKRTMVMNAVDQELLAKLTAGEGEVEHLTRRTGEHEVVDDGLRTTVMDAVDPSALGIEVSASGSFRAASPDDSNGDEEDDDNPSTSKPNMPAQGGGKKKKKRRR